MPVKTVVIRHPNENLAKCSLTPLHGRPEIEFLTGEGDMRFDATDYIVLAVDFAGHLAGRCRPAAAPARPLLGAVAETHRPGLPHAGVYRSLPDAVRTAYPRVSKMHKDPAAGLASVEALYLARKLLGDDDLSLLDGYYWKDAFLEKLPAELRS